MEENQLLLNSYDTSIDKLNESECKLESISSLMSEFSSKVLLQAEEIEQIHDAAYETNENLKKGNIELQEAVTTGVDFRIIALMIMVTCALSLLFYDWYQ